MKTTQYSFISKTGKFFNIIAPEDIEFPSFEYEFYGKLTACGAGKGIGDRIVPESVFGVRITLACFIHDYMFAVGERTWKDFHLSNAVFLSNIITIICTISVNHRWNFLKHLRLYRAITYYNAVDSLGQIFFSLEDLK